MPDFTRKKHMKNVIVKELTKARFDALVAYSRIPAIEFFSVEIDWYADDEERVIGCVLLDLIDFDYAAILLTRDENRRYRAIDVKASMPNKESATKWLKDVIERHAVTGQKVVPQEATTPAGVELFSTVAPIEELHPGFVKLRDFEGFSPARGIISEMMPHFIDVDGNFVEQFQTTGFDSRLWELYLFAYINEEGFLLERKHRTPDFIVTKYDKKVGIEAVTVGLKVGDNLPKFSRPDFLNHYMPIRYGSALFSKLKKRYWKLQHIMDKPLVFAIADFHADQSMLWSSSPLMDYLYGTKHNCHYDKDGKLVISPQKIEKHKVGEKEVPSGFFFQPNSEHVSAVLFSASGTISKFNRMGKLAGFGSPRVKLFREGTCHNHDPNAAFPRIFHVEVDPNKYSETWAEGLSMFHNPNALYPVPEELFPSVAQHYYKEGQIVSKLPEFHPYASLTFVMIQDGILSKR